MVRGALRLPMTPAPLSGWAHPRHYTRITKDIIENVEDEETKERMNRDGIPYPSPASEPAAGHGHLLITIPLCSRFA